MSSTIKSCVVGSFPPCYVPDRLTQRSETLGTPERPDGFVDLISEEETPSQQRMFLKTSFNFVDYFRSREILSKDKRHIDPSYTFKNILTHDMCRETPISIGNMNKVLCSQWLSHGLVIFGTECNKLMVYDVNTRQLENIPLLRARYPWNVVEHEMGIKSVVINESRSLLATGARDSYEIAVYRLPTLDPFCVAEGHTAQVLGMSWVDDDLLVSQGIDRIYLWKISSSSREHDHLPMCSYIRPKASNHSNYRMNFCAVTCNKTRKEIASLTFSEVVGNCLRLFSPETLKQTYNRKLPGICRDRACLTTDHRNMYAIGCKSHTLLADNRVLNVVKRIPCLHDEDEIRSISFQGKMLTIGGSGLIFYDLTAGKYLDLCNKKPVELKPFNSYEFEPVNHFPAIHTHCYDATGTKIFIGGGPLEENRIGSYAGLWQ